MPSTRIAVTGFGAVTPVGSDAESSWQAFLAGRSGVAELQEDWAAELPVRIAAVVAPGVEDVLEVRERKRMDRVEQLALVAGREAWAHAGSPATEPDRTAVVVGTAIGGLTTTLRQETILENSGARRVSPHTVTMMMGNGPAAWLSMDIGARAGARTTVSACASASEALVLAREMILAGTADVVLAGGAEACVTGLTLASLAQTRALSRREGDPTGASRPFDVGRDGFVLGEGAALLVLEREEHAIARGATIHGWLNGGAVTSDAHDIVAADPANQQRTVELALRSADVSASDIGFVHAHATSTPLGDVNESRAVMGAIGDHAAVTSIKSMIGHLLGASGAIGAIAALRTMHDGLVPPTINVEEVDPEIAVDVVANTVRPTTASAGIVNAFGFGGHNATLVFTRA